MYRADFDLTPLGRWGNTIGLEASQGSYATLGYESQPLRGKKRHDFEDSSALCEDWLR
jgi:hypothetical protein